MNTITKILAPAAVALFAFNAQAANFSTGGETYQGTTIASAPSAPGKVALGERVNTGGETYVGVANQIRSFDSPSISAGFSTRELVRLYLG